MLTSRGKSWAIYPSAPAEHLERFPELPPLIVQLLYNRQILTASQVQQFMDRCAPEANPFRLLGMNEAVARLRQSFRQKELIAVYGDYDVDGVTATALLIETFRALGAEAIPYIPKRLEEGYGLSNHGLAELAERGVKVVVTVDCGVRSSAEAQYAHSLGMELIITDHHGLASELPKAVAVIDPRRADETYPFTHLTGVGLAYKLAQALLRVERRLSTKRSQDLPEEESFLDLVALGTVADLAPLIGENRVLVSRGLARLNQAARPGMAAMLQESGLRQGQVTSGSVGFVLGPRLNAAGRLDDAMVSYQLLTTDSSEEACALAQQLGMQNQKRRQLLEQMLQHAREQVGALHDQRVYVLADESYSAGVAGLVAGRIVEEFYRPTLIIALDGESGKGSARSIEGFHITHALDECCDLLEQYGGHSAAAGFSISRQNVEPFRAKISQVAACQLTQEQLVAKLHIDMEIPLRQASGSTLALLEAMEPFGAGNPQPVFVSRNVQVRNAHAMGRDGATLKLVLSDGTSVWDAVAFRQRLSPSEVPKHIDVAYTMQRHTWNGVEELQLVVEDWQAASL